jgi:hypothetical protein
MRYRATKNERGQYTVEMRNGEWYVIEGYKYHENLRGPFATKAEAEQRLKEYGPLKPPKRPRPPLGTKYHTG